MSSTAFSRTSNSALLSGVVGSLTLLIISGCATLPGKLLYRDDFADLANWHIEAEKPGRVAAADGVLDIEVPAGVTLWFKPRLEGPMTIEFEATAVSEGGPNDQVSDLNVFWMARNTDGQEPVFAHARSGAFAEYNDLRTYYVGLGGNRNTTSRFRRYIGDPVVRPLLPEHDVSARTAMLVPNQEQTITLIADGSRIEYRRDGETLFRLDDREPYTQGWFALRTTYSHLRIRALRIYAGRGD
jgi:hypothetical protein